MRGVRRYLILLVLGAILAGSGPALAQYEPPHSRPGPTVDRIYFKAFHVDIAPAALKKGEMDLYVYSLKTVMAKELEDVPGVHMYQAPATSLSLVLNPSPAPEGQLNPLSIREVRFALNYVLNREFVAQEIFKGMAVPMIAHLSPFDYDYLTIYPLVRECNISYQPELAKRMVKEAMTQAGAVLKDGYWHYGGKPVELRFIIRVEDERREIGDLIRVELEKLGFLVIPIYHMFAPAIFTVYGTDPQLFQWHLYTEGWGRAAPDRYDFATINQMYAPWLGNMPGWQEVGYWQYQHPELDELGQRLFKGDFQSLEERSQLYLEATRLGLEEAVRLWIATVINNFPGTAELQGVTEDITAGPKGLWTLREAHVPGRQELTIGNLWVWTERSAWNPVGGFGDVYSNDIWKNVHDPPLWRHPFTGIPIPFRVKYQVDTAGPEGKLDVPADAFLWDADAGRFLPVKPGTKATSRVVFDYSDYFGSRWHHGEPITMADVLYSIYQAFDLAYNEDKAKIEFALATTSKPFLEAFRGFRLVDDARLEVYVDFWHFVPDYIAGYASPASLSMPWEILAAMDELVFVKRQAAYSDTTAERFRVPWLSLVIDRDARLVKKALAEFIERGYLPESPFTLNGTPLTSREEALRRYRAAISWFDRHGLMVISNGPFQLVRFDPPAQFAELEAFRDPTYPFRPGQWFFGEVAAVEIAKVAAEPIYKGEDAQIEAELRGPGRLGAKYVLFDPVKGEVLRSGEAEPVSATRFSVALSPEETSVLEPGIYHLFLVAHSDEVSSLAERRADIEVRALLPEATPTTPAAPSPTPEAPEGGLRWPFILIPVLVLAAVSIGLLVLRRIRGRKAV
ncbi:MAG TPA: hypothetical protein G4O03_03765 [Dehalococcoidia bacterium]|nr:hypothetical protein [Dehalococcoidia bacterium]